MDIFASTILPTPCAQVGSELVWNCSHDGKLVSPLNPLVFQCSDASPQGVGRVLAMEGMGCLCAWVHLKI